MNQDMKVEQYLNGRWQSQHDYYSRSARKHKIWHQILLIISSVGSVLVPVLLTIPEITKWFPIIISLLVSLALVLDNTLHVGDNWRTFRQTLEALKQERAYYDARIEPYVNPLTAFPLFVQRSEKIMGKEGERYFEKQRPAEQVGNNPSRIQ